MDANPDSAYLREKPRTLRQVLADLIAQFDALPIDDRRRCDLVRRIREAEALIDAAVPPPPEEPRP
jgi:hypothetical protein